ncbi:bifunctional diaminohydroxyphosphoribosylaminopyrimidine deaminase/5-amino-6-(5-phosphoribosylamino)uracil reductase RibD [Sphingomonas qilianensis]|uniref:Riboflavin biosynthesis protein RibD n=1 Tax=Sphingomonas qilianensis TaxID=1736690 RepID=A0ABU9XW50_9SPHN
MAAALALAERGRGRTAPNPNVGCVIVRDGRVIGRGWTQPGGRPHAEAMALAKTGAAARGATVYTTLEPCVHVSSRGPACADLLITAGVTRVVVALVDPDVRTDGSGIARLQAAGIDVATDMLAGAARRSMGGFLTRQKLGRPFVTLKLALSADGAVAMASGTSKWITGPEARAHAHLERARHEAILVGRGTMEADVPTLDVRLPGLQDRAPQRIVLSTSRHPGESGGIPAMEAERAPLADPSFRWGDGGAAWGSIARPADIATLAGVDHLLVEGGAQTAASFLHDDLVDRMLFYRASILIGGGRTLPDIGLTDLAAAHGRWSLHDTRRFGSDRLDIYERTRS